MTQAKKLKKAIRARARKTRESYSAARRQVLLAKQKHTGRAAALKPAQQPKSSEATRRAASLGSVSDATSLKRTGHGLEHWFRVLDAFGAAQKGHTAAAEHLYRDHGIPGWYCQGITVAYERARGLRSVNQACTGTFQVSVSRVVSAPVSVVVGAVKEDAARAAWLADADRDLVAALRAGLHGPRASKFAVRDKGDARLRFKWGASTVEIRISPRPNGKASVVADTSGLPAAGLVEPRRESWRLALDGLRRHLGG
jgi:hypothetical protein